MRYKVTAKQENSKMCLVCGLRNPFSLRTQFYELENNELMATFRPLPEHQSYPGRLHGGIASALLDETIGRAILMHTRDVWGVTIEVQTRYRRPVPIAGELRVIGRITKENRRSFSGSGEILLPDGTVAVEATGRYLKLTLDQIADFDFVEQEWQVTAAPDDPTHVDF